MKSESLSKEAPGVLLTADEFESRTARALQGISGGAPHMKLILLGFGGLDDLVSDLGTQITRAILREVRVRLNDAIPAGIPTAHLFADRFGILLNDEDGDGLLTERALGALRRPIAFHEESISVQPRFGIATTRNVQGLSDLLRRATAALKRAEATGCKSPTLYQTNQMPLHAADPRLSMELSEALEQGRIVPWLQPLWRLSDGKMVGVEALARWIHPERGVISPGVFLPLARRAGLLGTLDEAIRCKSMEWLSRARRNNKAAEDLTISVNIADADLSDPGLLDQILSELAIHDLTTDSIILELSERAATAHAPDVEGRIRRIADAGIQWHLDDFGTGHSTIQRLQGLPFKAVKLDRSMIRGLGRDPHGEHLLKPMIALARALKLEVVAEGVERGEQLQTLTRLGCDMAQGHHLSPPRPPEALDRIIEGRNPSPRSILSTTPVDARP